MKRKRSLRPFATIIGTIEMLEELGQTFEAQRVAQRAASGREDLSRQERRALMQVYLRLTERPRDGTWVRDIRGKLDWHRIECEKAERLIPLKHPSDLTNILAPYEEFATDHDYALHLSVLILTGPEKLPVTGSAIRGACKWMSEKVREGLVLTSAWTAAAYAKGAMTFYRYGSPQDVQELLLRLDVLPDGWLRNHVLELCYTHQFASPKQLIEMAEAGDESRSVVLPRFESVFPRFHNRETSLDPVPGISSLKQLAIEKIVEKYGGIHRIPGDVWSAEGEATKGMKRCHRCQRMVFRLIPFYRVYPRLLDYSKIKMGYRGMHFFCSKCLI